MSEVERTHPEFDTSLSDWELMRDSHQGEKQVKARTTRYLPPTPGHLYDGMDSTQKVGYKNYEAYLQRAVFPEYVGQAVETFIGLLHNEPPTIELPERMEYLRERATLKGDTLEGLLIRMNIEQLITGRLGLLVDMPTEIVTGDPEFYITMYEAEKVRNWDAVGEGDNVELEMVVLDESGYERDGTFGWVERKVYRVIMMDEAAYKFAVVRPEVSGDFSEGDLQAPSVRGNALDKLPFIFLNSKDIAPEPDMPPLISLARLCMTIYRGEADYRHTLFLQGQDTLVVVGGAGADEDEPLRVGAGARIDVDEGGDAKYISVGSEGLSEQRTAIENDRKRAESRSGQLIQESKAGVESGDALRQRLGSQTATLNQIAISAAQALENILKVTAEWLGADPSEVVINPNLEFGPIVVETRELVEIMSAKGLGLPLSEESVHEYLQERKLTTKTYEEEQQALEADREAAAEREPEGTGFDDPDNPAPNDEE